MLSGPQGLGLSGNDNRPNGTANDLPLGAKLLCDKRHRPGGLADPDDRRGRLNGISRINRPQELNLPVGTEEPFVSPPGLAETKPCRGITEEFKNLGPGH